MWYKINWIYVWNQKVRPAQSSQVLFDYGDWTNSQWTTFWTQWTITKTSSSVAFSNSSGFCQNTLADYTIDISRDFLFEFNADIPTTNASYHYVELWWVANIGTNWEHSWKICYIAPNIWWQATNENIAGARDYFIRREWNVLTIWWDNTAKYTDNNCTLTGTYSISEQNYSSTLIIYTAKFTYL